MESNNLKYINNKVKVIHQVPLLENIIQYLNYAAKTNPYSVALKIRRNQVLEQWSFKQYKETVYKCAKSLLKLKLTSGTSININSYNNPEWFFVYFACLFTKHMPTGIYITSSSSQCSYFFNESNAEMAFVEDQERLKKYIEIKDSIPKCKAIVLMESISGYEDQDYSNLPFKVYKWNEFIELGNGIDDETIDEISKKIKKEDNATLIFTSGTSFKPKACIMSHKNYVACGFYGTQIFFDKVTYGREVFLSYLPLSHITDQIGNLIISLMVQGIVTFGDRDALRGSLLNTLKEFKPTCFIGVPRVLEKMQFKIENEIKNMSIFKRSLVEWGLKVSLENSIKIKNGESPSYQYSIAYSLVIKKILDSIGLTNVKVFASGSAPISLNTIQFFKSIGLSIVNCYGLSETTGATVVTPISNSKPGSVGKMNNGEVKIADDGEILMKGDFIFKCYYNDENSTKEAFDSDGWFHTGDIGLLDNDGDLYITDRKKDIIITSGGENISPSMIENKLRIIPGIEHSIVIGDKQKFLVCLIVINLDYFNQKFNSNNNNKMTLEEASNDNNVIKYIQDNIDFVNKDLARVQTIKRFKILPNEFTEGNDNSEITATKKIRRKIIIQKYQNQIKELYGNLYFE